MRHTYTLLAALMLAPLPAAESPSNEAQHLAQAEVWTEKWHDASLKVATRTVAEAFAVAVAIETFENRLEVEAGMSCGTLHVDDRRPKTSIHLCPLYRPRFRCI